MMRPGRDWWLVVGLSVTATAAAVGSFAGLRSLATATGWPDVLAPLLPVAIDTYAATASRAWLSQSTRSRRARRFARWNAIGAIGLSVLGNSAAHLISTGVVAVTWPVVLAVGAVPPTVLGLLAHLAALLQTQDEARASSTDGSTARTANSAPSALPRAGEDEAVPGRPDQDEGQDGAAAGQDEESDELLAAARDADAAHRASHGKPITRDELRRTLRVSTERATTLLRQVRESADRQRTAHLPTVDNSTIPDQRREAHNADK
jgi:hypothetical protein